MKNRALVVVMGLFLVASQAFAQGKTVTGRVTNEQGAPVAGASVVIKGTRAGAVTNGEGRYAIRAEVGQVLVYRLIGNAPVERTVGDADVIDVQLRKMATALDAVVVSALGQTASQRSLGAAQQTVSGVDIAKTQRSNFVNALQGRVAGVEVTSTSGVPGASSSITIRGVSSISSSNQPLMIVDGLPLDNKTLHTSVLASDAPGSQSAFNNRGVDFTNRAADLNPDDIETLVVLKGPEAAALYGIDAASGAIVITTKHGRAGTAGMDYSNSFRVERVGTVPSMQRTYGLTSPSGFSYFGDPYPDTTTFYNNVDGFFRSALTAKNSLAYSGATADNRINYRVSLGADRAEGVVRNSDYGRFNVTGRSQSQINRWLQADLSMQYSAADNNQPYKGDNGVLVGLLLWPQTDDAKNYLTAAGTRRRLTTAAATGEVDNPYFNVAKNKINSSNNRLVSNLGFVLTPLSWGSLSTNVGIDYYSNGNLLLRNPESAIGNQFYGVIDQANDVTRNLNAQTLFRFYDRALTTDLSVNGTIGHQVADFKWSTNSMAGQNFLDPNFVSMNNATLRMNRTTTSQRRLVSVFGTATLDYKKWAYLNLTGRNDWTSTIPVERNSFFYPSVSTSFVFSDAFPSIGRFMTGRIRAAYAEVGKDARPYSYLASLESKLTSYSGYGAGFTGPNLDLKPEFKLSRELGAEMTFLNDRLGLDVTFYRSTTKDQIVDGIRTSYATGYILFNLNGAVTATYGTEITLRGTPIFNADFQWDALLNFNFGRGYVRALPNALPESYMSDTWLAGNVRNGTKPGMSTRSLTGYFYMRNNNGDILIDPTSGLPLRHSSFVCGCSIDGSYPGQREYDRQPDYTAGLTNTFRYRKFSLDFLLDIRKGGDVYNATGRLLTSRGLTRQTLDREQPRVIKGVLRDGRENSANPTVNTIVVIPRVQPLYYTNISEELFIERDINWVRLKDVTLRVILPGKYLYAREASMFVTGTDLLLFTNYSGLDPIVSGNTAAVGGSGGAGIDLGNFPMPRGVNFGLTLKF